MPPAASPSLNAATPTSPASTQRSGSDPGQRQRDHHGDVLMEHVDEALELEPCDEALAAGGAKGPRAEATAAPGIARPIQRAWKCGR